MNVLVTGGTGFTGSALVLRLLDAGHSVVSLDHQPGLDAGKLRARGARLVTGSVTDAPLMQRVTQGVDFVFHLAAAFRELDVPDTHYENVNVDGTRNALEAALQNGVSRFVYCSTCGVHGNVAHPPADEDAPIAPADYYQRTKYEAEPIVRAYGKRGMSTVILRPAAIYGPGDPERFFLLFKRVAAGTFPMFGNGRTLYHPLYIDNLVDAFMLCLDPTRGEGGTYLIADQDYCSIEELVQEVAKSMGREPAIRHYPIGPLIVAGHLCESICKPIGIRPPIFPRRVDWYRQNRAFDIGRARRELGYAPTVDLREGLRRTAQWYVDTGMLPEGTLAHEPHLSLQS
ncbi:MAG: NAD(P)-dependent oxidoreductase [Gemmatimonadota bacterium]